jgi:hypothetical protein
MRFLLRILVVTTLGVITAVVVRTAMWAGPALRYGVAQPSIRSECAGIHVGMTFSDVDAAIHSRTAPYDEALSINGFDFSRYPETCKVDLDPATHKVVKTEMVDGPGGVE